ncbi:hypothetical protein IQ238_20165 [Pleurocapsales cyanobacterium LEGE 06147]|nr:hypothetical protein [Pleurocapsales cyanobacterium LEGE 06147]
MNANISVPNITTLEQAVALLHQCLDLSSLSNAVEYLEQRELRYQLLSLYSHFFPQQYAQSKASVYPGLDEEDGWLRYTEREIKFLQLVHQNLFPLHYLDYLLEERVDFIELRSILVTPLGMGQLEDYEMSYCDLALGDKILLPMSTIGRENLENWHNHLDEDCYGKWFEAELSSPPTMAEIAHPYSIDFKKLRRMCFQTKKPICYLPLTLRLLDLNTNNIWLDEEGGWLQGMEGTTLDWSKENVNYLHREYLKAQRILDAAGFFIGWLETDLNNNFQSVLRLWNQCSTHH